MSQSICCQGSSHMTRWFWCVWRCLSLCVCAGRTVVLQENIKNDTKRDYSKKEIKLCMMLAAWTVTILCWIGFKHDADSLFDVRWAVNQNFMSRSLLHDSSMSSFPYQCSVATIKMLLSDKQTSKQDSRPRPSLSFLSVFTLWSAAGYFLGLSHFRTQIGFPLRACLYAAGSCLFARQHTRTHRHKQITERACTHSHKTTV